MKLNQQQEEDRRYTIAIKPKRKGAKITRAGLFSEEEKESARGQICKINSEGIYRAWLEILPADPERMPELATRGGASK